MTNKMSLTIRDFNNKEVEITSYYYTICNGHKVYRLINAENRITKDWYYIDFDENDTIVSIQKATYTKPCPKCNEMPTKEGYDHCLGFIEGAKAACCGHGSDEFDAYILYNDGREIRTHPDGRVEESQKELSE